jgi:vancomycin permeability regulator SanA
MLAARIDTGMALARDGVSDVLLFSGDNGQEYYNEVAVMKSYALENAGAYGVKKSMIYLDHAGFSTYDSMYRLGEVFMIDRAVVVTQKYHLYRALYIANARGIDAYGVAAAPKESGQLWRDIREILARTKDVLFTITNQKPKYLGDPIIFG